MKRKTYWIVDGHNVIFANKEYWHFIEEDTELSRLCLQRELMNIARLRGLEVLLVFDGKLSQHRADEEEVMPGFRVIYTSRQETADSYIERTVYELQGKYVDIYVVTSDGQEQMQVLGSGAFRMSAREFVQTLQEAKKETTQKRQELEIRSGRSEVSERLKGSAIAALEKLRRQ